LRAPKTPRRSSSPRLACAAPVCAGGGAPAELQPDGHLGAGVPDAVGRAPARGAAAADVRRGVLPARGRPLPAEGGVIGRGAVRHYAAHRLDGMIAGRGPLLDSFGRPRATGELVLDHCILF